jgi:hypothetical protein
MLQFTPMWIAQSGIRKGKKWLKYASFISISYSTIFLGGNTRVLTQSFRFFRQELYKLCLASISFCSGYSEGMDLPCNQANIEYDTLSMIHVITGMTGIQHHTKPVSFRWSLVNSLYPGCPDTVSISDSWQLRMTLTCHCAKFLVEKGLKKFLYKLTSNHILPISA